MDYKKISQFGMIIGLIGTCLSLIISLASNMDVFISLQRAVVTFLVLWFLSQFVWVAIMMMISRIHEEIKEEKKQEIIDEQRKKIENSEDDAAEKVQDKFKKLNDEIDDKMDKARANLANKRKGVNADHTINDQESS